jgi:hypothetical protein
VRKIKNPVISGMCEVVVTMRLLHNNDVLIGYKHFGEEDDDSNEKDEHI